MNRIYNDDDIRVEKNKQGVDIYYFDPFNPLNKEIPTDIIQNIMKEYGLNMPIHNYELYKRAFIHRSYTKRPDIENKENFKTQISIQIVRIL
mgnify:CR=1 FL=1